jgi:hypothetical protein
MDRHDNDIRAALFTVTHGGDLDNNRNPRNKYFKGQILAGKRMGTSFLVEYEKISEEADIDGYNDEASICFRDRDSGYVRISVSFCDDPSVAGVIFKELQSTPSGEFRYMNYMSHVAYIIMSGMILANI